MTNSFIQYKNMISALMLLRSVRPDFSDEEENIWADAMDVYWSGMSLEEKNSSNNILIDPNIENMIKLIERLQNNSSFT